MLISAQSKLALLRAAVATPPPPQSFSHRCVPGLWNHPPRPERRQAAPFSLFPCSSSGRWPPRNGPRARLPPRRAGRSGEPPRRRSGAVLGFEWLGGKMAASPLTVSLRPRAARPPPAGRRRLLLRSAPPLPAGLCWAPRPASTSPCAAAAPARQVPAFPSLASVPQGSAGGRWGGAGLPRARWAGGRGPCPPLLPQATRWRRGASRQGGAGRGRGPSEALPARRLFPGDESLRGQPLR